MRRPADLAMARERELFLSSGSGASRVRADISSSWRRCLSWAVPTERLAPPYRPEVDRDCRLVRAAAPVLDSISERLGESGVSFILTDAEARIVDRRVRQSHLANLLDARSVVAGFVFAEHCTGTNGLGTAIELGRTTRIDGYEHYSSDLVDFTCVGVPIVDPIRRRPLGVLDVTCAADRDNTLVTLIAEQAARAIETRLVEQHTQTERALLSRFLATSRNTHSGVVVLNERIVMTNPLAARLLEGVNQALLWDQAARATTSEGVVPAELRLANGELACARITALRDGGEVIGALMEIRPLDLPAARHRALPRPAAPRNPLLVGDDPAFVEACRVASEAPPDQVLLLCGEPGVGKSTLARELLRPRSDVREVDAAAAELTGVSPWLEGVRSTLDPPPGALIVRHVDLLDAAAARSLSALLAITTARGSPCTVTFTDGSDNAPPLPGLDHKQVWLPPLRNRPGDLPALVAAFAAPRQVTPEVVQLLQRLSWPGNVRELRAVVRRIVAAAPPGSRAGLSAVPADVRRAATRRNLTRFERAEVHAIVAALAETAGNKKDAAALLGISRSTLYRKLQTAGIDLENTIY